MEQREMNILTERKTMLLGSCFSANIGEKMREAGLDVTVNPFGTIFNPASIIASLHRLENPVPFTEEDCVMMGAGANLWCSFSHYTKFARATKEEFLAGANAALEEAAARWRECGRVILTFGTAWCFRHNATAETDPLLSSLFPGRPRIVSNCLKRPGGEYSHELLKVGEIVEMYRDLVAGCGKEVIFTVSPIRHLSDGPHANQLSKATLLLAQDEIIRGSSNCRYFPAYEIVLDELRDYSWYAADKVHPGPEAVDRIWSAFRRWLANN